MDKIQLPWGPLKIALGLAAVLVLAAGWVAASSLGTSDRHLSGGKKNTFVNTLRNAGWNPGNVALRYKAECDECRSYAADLAAALAMAGWSDKAEIANDQNDELTGLQIVVANLKDRPHDADLLAEALIRANIRFRLSTSDPPPITPAILFVYPKP